jgi:hypothetical protein
MVTSSVQSQQSETRGDAHAAWRTALIIAAIALAGYFVVNMLFRQYNSWPHFSIQGDQHQSIGHFWRYYVEGTIPPGHLLSDYAWTYHAPPFFWLLMSTLSSLLDPLLASKVLAWTAYIGFITMAVLIVGKRTDWILACFVGMLIMRNPPDNPDQLTGGLARGNSATLLYLFVYAFMSRNHPLVLLTLVLQAGTYPAISIACTITYGMYCVLAGPDMRTRLRRCAGMTVAGILIFGLGVVASSRTPEWWGGSVTFEEAKAMPAWRAGGRFPEVPHRDFRNAIEHNLTRQYKDLGDKPVPAAAVRWVAHHQVLTFVTIPLAIAALAAALSQIMRMRARRRGAPPVEAASDGDEDDDSPLAQARRRWRRFPWELAALAAGSLVSYAIVRIVAFKLFLPSRQIGFTLPYVFIIGTPIVVWWGLHRLMPKRRAAVLVLTILIAVVPAFVFRGHGFGTTSAGYRHHKSDEKLYNTLRKVVPPNEEIACDMTYCEFMMPMAQRVPYAARNLTHPLRKGYYDEAERRLVKMHEVLYATSPQQIADFVATEKVRFFVYRKGKVTKLETGLHKPADARVRQVFNKGTGKTRLLADPPKEAIVFRDGDRYLLDLSKWPKSSTASSSTSPPADEEAAPDDATSSEPAVLKQLKTLKRSSLIKPKIAPDAAPP